MKLLTIISLVATCALMATNWPIAAEERSVSAPTCTTTCCAKCGCHEGLVPVCHTYCTTKKETKYRYYCKCETICVPEGCHSGTACAQHGCSDTCDGNDCGCKCFIKDTYKLVKVPYTVETPVKKCTVEWVCPHCGCSCGCTEQSDSATKVPPPIRSH